MTIVQVRSCDVLCLCVDYQLLVHVVRDSDQDFDLAWAVSRALLSCNLLSWNDFISWVDSASRVQHHNYRSGQFAKLLRMCLKNKMSGRSTRSMQTQAQLHAQCLQSSSWILDQL